MKRARSDRRREGSGASWRAAREDDSRIRTKPGLFARLRSFALNLLRANGVGNVSEALYANALSLDRLLALGTE
jgi:hypothetical protein